MKVILDVGLSDDVNMESRLLRLLCFKESTGRDMGDGESASGCLKKASVWALRGVHDDSLCTNKNRVVRQGHSIRAQVDAKNKRPSRTHKKA